MHSPEISIVIANYNSEKTITQTINSILNQTYTNFELIISDDGSTDNSRYLIEKYARQDSRIVTVFNNHQGFISRVLNKGFSLAKGTYFGVVDCDDYLRHDCLELCLNFIKNNPDSQLIYTNHAIVDENNLILGLGDRCKIGYDPKILLLNFITYHFRLFHRDLYNKINKFDESFYRCSDFDFCLKASELTNIKQLKETLYFYRVHSNQITQKRKDIVLYWSYKAIKNALIRRGLDKIYNLTFQRIQTKDKILGKYRLVKKT